MVGVSYTLVGLPVGVITTDRDGLMWHRRDKEGRQDVLWRCGGIQCDVKLTFVKRGVVKREQTVGRQV